MKKLLTISVLILCLFCVNIGANEHAWVPGDRALITDCCTKPDVLLMTAELYTKNDPESRRKAIEIWDAALLIGECFSIKPVQAHVILRELHKVVPNLHPTFKGVDGELWEAELMNKGSSGDFEPIGIFVFIGIYEKPFSASNPENQGKYNRLSQGT